MGKIRSTKQLAPQEQFVAVNDQKLRMTLVAMADKYDARIRQIIYHTYQDNQLASIYRGIRASGIYDTNKRQGAYAKKILEIPNRYVADFLDTVLGALYGPNWWKDPKALRHELCRPWWVVNKI